LLRQKIPVEIDRLLADSVYAAEVLLMCEYTEQTDLISLAGKLSSMKAEHPGHYRAAGRASRFVAAFRRAPTRARDRQGWRLRSRLFLVTMPTSTGAGATGSDEPPTPEPGDPDAPRNRRYLRGARLRAGLHTA
jgi:hypothetical protein